MPDQLEQSLREALSHHAAQLDPDSLARLRAIDFHPRRRRVRTLPAVGALGATGVATAVAAIVALGSSAAPAFAGWQRTPTPPAPGQLAQAAQSCGQDLGSPVLTDSRGPYTAAIYGNSTTTAVCLSGNGVSEATRTVAPAPVTVATGQIQLGGGGTRDSAGNALTMLDGRTGAGVTAVTVHLSDGSSVQATVTNGWYLAWWPGTLTATSATITAASGTSTVTVPAAPTMPAPKCSSDGSSCSAGYSFGSAESSGNGPATPGQSVVHGSSSSSTSSH